MKRQCGECRECCIVLEVDAMRKPADVPCRHLCGKGCGIYSRRPESCKVFTCAWREGLLGFADRPSKSHMVIWLTKMSSPGGKELQVLQCNVRAGHKRHKKTLRWLRTSSFKMPVLIIERDVCELYSLGKPIIKWHEDEFVNLHTDRAGNITGGHIVPRDEVLRNPEEAAAWERLNRMSLEVKETDPIYRREQLNYLEGKT